MRRVKRLHSSEVRPTGYLSTYSPVPTRRLSQIDPFIFLNHHGPQNFAPNNQGLPFGPHPHRGIETITIIVNGDIVHEDTEGHQSVIEAGGVQWMTAGSGLLHSETSSEHFIREGGNMEILQLWLNLPAAKKWSEPAYEGLAKADIPQVQLDKQGSSMQLIAGKWHEYEGAHKALTDVFLSTLTLKSGAQFSTEIATERNIFLYLIDGRVAVNEVDANTMQLVEFSNDGTTLELEAKEDSLLIFGHATPYGEPMVAEGPFVMNTQEEILQAYRDFREGKMGTWHR